MPDKPAARKLTLLSRASALVATTLTVALAAGLVAGASALVAERAEAPGDTLPQPIVTVETVPLRLQDSYEVTVAYRGRVEASQRVEIGFEAGGTLESITADEGEVVARGSVLATLDTRALEADRAALAAAREALAAQTELARRTADRQKALADRDHSSAQRLDEAELTLAQLEAELRRADAALTGLDIALEKAVLTAPFDARIGRRAADPGTRLAPGQTVVELLETEPPEIRIGVPSDIAATLAPGDTARVEIGGRVIEAILKRIRADIDPATRTRDIVFALPERDFAAGSLGTLKLTREVPGTGAWVPMTALSEGVRGLWTVFIVENGTARREAVEVVHTDGERAFIRGHFDDGAKVVANGPHRIAAGQRVAAEG